MDVLLIIALMIVIPVILFPAAFVWYLNIGGILTVWKERMVRETRRKVLRKVDA